MGFQENFERGVRAAEAKAFGCTVTLTHGELVTLPFVATWEELLDEVIAEEGFATALHRRTFQFSVEHAAYRGSRFEPQEGDKILLNENGTSKLFEILPTPGRKSVELTAGGYRWRVLTKQVK